MEDEPRRLLRDDEPALRTDAYAAAGVDIAAGNAAVERYRALTVGRRHPSQLGAIGGFSGLFAMPGDPSRALVGSTDGVGTKVLIAAALRKYDTVGADLVNHCVNDILVSDATPLFFLDYLAFGKLDPDVAGALVGGVEAACREHDMALLGGETAEMPGVYDPPHFDLAGTIVGVVDVARIPRIERVEPGDAIVGLPATGLHTNGYSLVRRLLPPDRWDADLMGTHPSYYRAVRAIEAVADVKAMSHITGGGLLENLPRTLPANCKAVLEQSRWSIPAIMRELVELGGLSPEERYRTFNMGIGYTLVIPLAEVANATAAWPGATVIGWIEKRRDGDPPIVIQPARDAR